MISKKNKENRLSIQFSLDGFSFLVFAPEKSKIAIEKEVWNKNSDAFYDWLKVKLAAEETFRETFSATSILYAPEKITVVPRKLTQEQTTKNNLFKMALPLNIDEEIITEERGEYTFLYAIPQKNYQILQEYLPNANWNSPTAFLVDKIQCNKKWSIGTLIFNKRLYLMVMKNGTLHFSNTFSFQTKEDLLYYMLYIFDNFSIPIADSEIQLWGNYNYAKLLVTELERYHDAVQVMTSNKAIPKSSMGDLLLSNI